MRVSAPVEAVSDCLRRAIVDGERPTELDEQVSVVVAKALTLYARSPLWAVAELPRRAAAGLVEDAWQGNELAAAAILFYCASDIMDDAQDGELPSWASWRWPWSQAVNTGTLFLFLCQRHLLSLDANAEITAAWSAEFAHAGRRMAIAQHRDLDARVGRVLTEEAVTEITLGKAGAPFGFFAALPAIGVGSSEVASWRMFGEKLGMLHQLASDVWPYLIAGPQRDLAVGQLTLPLHYALAADPQLADLWFDQRELDPERQEVLRARVHACGGVMYAEMRVEILKQDALNCLAGLACPGAESLLSPLIHAVTFQQPHFGGA